MNKYLLKLNNLFFKTKNNNILYAKDFIVPKNDWIKIIFCFFIVFISIIIFSTYFYFQISGGKFFSKYEEENIDKSVVINQKLLIKVTDDINARKIDRENLDRGTPTDPSI